MTTTPRSDDRASRMAVPESCGCLRSRLPDQPRQPAPARAHSPYRGRSLGMAAVSSRDTLRNVPLTISVIGTGYLGVVHAACMADLGHTVIAIDTDAAKIESLAQGVPAIYEPGLDELLTSALATGRLRFTTD